jgi:transporter family-2 protein
VASVKRAARAVSAVQEPSRGSASVVAVVSGNALAVIIGLAAGVASAFQSGINAALGRRIGTLEAAAFQTVVALAAFVIVTLIARQSLGGVADAVRQPAWLWLGGVMGFVIVFAITYAPAKIGTFATAGLLIALQLVATAIIDHYGFFGLERIGFTWERAIGFALLAGGAVLALRR